MGKPIDMPVKVQRGQRVDGFGESESVGWEIVGGDDVIADCNVEAVAHRIANALNVLARVEDDALAHDQGAMHGDWHPSSVFRRQQAIADYRTALLQEPEGEGASNDS